MYSLLEQQDPPVRNNIPVEGILASVLIAIIAFITTLIDSGPIVPPFPNDFSSFDCMGVSLYEYEEQNGEVNFYFKAPPSVEYPPEYLPNFITIKAETQDIPIIYTADYYSDIKRDSQILNISIKHNFGGNTSFHFKCLNNELGYITHEVSDPKYSFNDRSRTYNPHGDEAYYTDVCLEYQKILYFTKLKTEKTQQKHDKDPLTFEFLDEKLGRYMEFKSVKTNQNNTFLISNTSTYSWKTAMFWGIPIANSIKNFGSDSNLFVLRDYPQPELLEILEKYSSFPVERQDDIMCFRHLHITRTLSDPQVTEELLDQYISMGVEAVQEMFKVDHADGVALGEELEAHFNEISALFPGKTTRILRHSAPVNETIATVAASTILIGTHYSSLAQAAFLPRGSIIVDLSSQGECLRFVERLAVAGGHRYVRVNAGGQCYCEKFECFSETPTKRFDLRKLQAVL